jgi:hypothetical protein
MDIYSASYDSQNSLRIGFTCNINIVQARNALVSSMKVEVVCRDSINALLE